MYLKYGYCYKSNSATSLCHLDQTDYRQIIHELYTRSLGVSAPRKSHHELDQRRRPARATHRSESKSSAWSQKKGPIVSTLDLTVTWDQVCDMGLTLVSRDHAPQTAAWLHLFLASTAALGVRCEDDVGQNMNGMTLPA
jgi:hypothetical protein